MHGVHFQFIELAIKGMLRWCMKMELGAIKKRRSTKELLADLRGELHFTILCIKVELRSVTIESHVYGTLIIVLLGKLISGNSWILIHSWVKI